LGNAVNAILGDPELKSSLEHATFAYAHEATWPRAGKAFLDVVTEVVAASRTRTLSPKGSNDLGHRTWKDALPTIQS
jgi:hypothetical protein